MVLDELPGRAGDSFRMDSGVAAVFCRPYPGPLHFHAGIAVMPSARRPEGYILVDHRESPGISQEDVAPGYVGLLVGKGQKFESGFVCCSHCQSEIILNPLRTRDRGYCPKCDRYICDSCAAELHRLGVCRTWAQVVDEIYEAAVKEGG